MHGINGIQRKSYMPIRKVHFTNSLPPFEKGLIYFTPERTICPQINKKRLKKRRQKKEKGVNYISPFEKGGWGGISC